jgi:hypothetical protein
MQTWVLLLILIAGIALATSGKFREGLENQGVCPPGYTEWPGAGVPAKNRCYKTSNESPIECDAGYTFSQETRMCKSQSDPSAREIQPKRCPPGKSFTLTLPMRCVTYEFSPVSSSPPPPASPPSPPASPPNTPQHSKTDFERTLELYQTNLTQFKLSGNEGLKTAADKSKKWLDDYVTTLKKQTEDGEKEIQAFVSEYSTDKDMAKLKTDMTEIREKGPKLQTIYETEHEAQKAKPVDFSLYYTKGAILGGVMALAVVAGMF